MRALIALILLCFAGAASAQTLPYHADPSARELVPNLAAVPSIRFLTTADFPPFNYRDTTGELVGFNVDLARALCADLTITCTIQAWPWDQAGKALEDGQGDALIAGLAMTPEPTASAVRFLLNLYDVARPLRDAVKERRRRSARRRLPASPWRCARVRTTGLRDALSARGQAVEFDTEFACARSGARWQGRRLFRRRDAGLFWLNDNPTVAAFAGAPYFRPDLFGDGLTIALPAGHDAVRQAIDYGLVRLKRRACSTNCTCGGSRSGST